MDLVWAIYLIDVFCSSWKGIGSLLFILLILSVVFSFIKAALLNDERKGSLTTSDEGFLVVLKVIPMKTIGVLSFLLLFSGNFIPSKETAYSMLILSTGQDIIETISKNEDVREILGDGVDILKIELSKYKEELQGSEQ